MQGFLEPTPDLRNPTGDGRNMVLLGPLDYVAADGTHYRALPGSTTDGLSVPQALWPKLPPIGPSWRAGVLHDAIYRGSCVRVNLAGSQIICGLDQQGADSLLHEMLLCCGVSEADAICIYEGVHLGGWKAWRDDLAIPIAANS